MKWLVIFISFFLLPNCFAVAADLNGTLEKIDALELLLKSPATPTERFSIYRDLLSNYSLLYNQPKENKEKIAAYKKRAREISEQGLALQGLSAQQKAILIHNKAQSYIAEDPQRGMELFTKAIQLSANYPGSSGALLILAEDHYEHDQYAAAAKYYRPLRGRQDIPANYVAMKYAYSNLKAKDFKEAEKAFIWLLKNSNERVDVDSAGEGLATTTCFSRSEAELVKLAENLFWSDRKKHMNFLVTAQKKRWAVNSSIETKPFDKLFSLTADNQEARRLMLDLFDIPAGSLKPAAAVAYLQRYQKWAQKKGSPDLGRNSSSSEKSSGMETFIYQQLAMGYSAYKKSGTVVPATAELFGFLAEFYISFFSATKNINDVTLMRADFCRLSKNYTCLGKIANEAPDKTLSNSLRLSLALEAALGGRPLKDLVLIKDQALLTKIAGEMKGEKLWRQVMPYLIDRELKSGDRTLALRWVEELQSSFPNDPEVNRWRGVTLSAQVREQLKTKQWAKAKENFDVIQLKKMLSGPEQKELVGVTLANLLLGNQFDLAVEIFIKNSDVIQNTVEMRQLAKALMKNAIARGLWDLCLEIRARVHPTSKGEPKDLEFEKAVCALAKYNGRTKDVKINWSTLTPQDLDYLSDLLSWVSPENFIAEKRWPNNKSIVYQKALYFAFQNSQQATFPALSGEQYVRVKLVAPSILKAGETTKAEAIMMAAKFPSVSQDQRKFLDEVLKLSQKGEEAARLFKIDLKKLNAREHLRVLKALADFEQKLAQLLDRAATPTGRMDQKIGSQNEEYFADLKVLSRQHRDQAKEYLRAYEVQQEDFRKTLASAATKAIQLIDSGHWVWPSSALAQKIKKEVKVSRYVGAMVALDFARPIFKISDEEYFDLRTLILLSRSQSEPVKIRLEKELEASGQQQIFLKYLVGI